MRWLAGGFAAVAWLGGGAASAGPLPRIGLVHAGLIERYCATVSPAKPDPAVLAEIEARIGEFEAAWAAEGPRLMTETVRLTGRPYAFGETIATLHGCPDLPSYSAPLLISAARYTRAWAATPGPRQGVAGLEAGRVTRAPTGARTVAPMSSFTYTVWHESAHRYVNDILAVLPGGTTPLLAQYAGEAGW